jgi:hypothetical protein
MKKSNYVIAIPTYNRADELVSKSLTTLANGNVPSSRIYIFVATKAQAKLYSDTVPKTMFHKIVVGQLGIANQRKYISNYFLEHQYIVSMDDDVEAVEKMVSPTKLTKISDLDIIFKEAYQKMLTENLYIWGVYPVHNPFFMKKTTTTGLKFIIGVLYGYINRHNKKLHPSPHAETKEDFEQSILYFKMDGGVVRYNYIVPKTKFNAPGGLGQDRFARNKSAAEYLKKTYPDIITIFHRSNGTPEVRLARLPAANATTAANANATKKSTRRKNRSVGATRKNRRKTRSRK